MPDKHVEFNGVTYSLMGAGKYYLSQSTTNAGRRQAKGLHVAIWEHYHERTVRKGFHIHHLDENPFNNAIENLVEISRSEHSKMHVGEHWAEAIKLGQEAAKEWHSSSEGYDWHSSNSKAQWENRPARKWECLQCGKTTKRKTIQPVKYCNSTCRQRHYFATGVTSIEVKCQVCGMDFRTTRARPGRTCSMKCRNRLKVR